ncbi:KilA-N domain-containing protein [Pectobacterium brasiliense]|uniref:KilA-N domain-containing protein n=1 Tax=Pectobacterium brasiliense TaxID=180957 RepID=UPI004043E798
MNTLLPIIINGHSFTCDENQMWNLNDIYRTLDLPDSKRPSEWNNQVRTQLDRSGNFRTVNGDGGGTWATEKGTIAYAMWVSTDFYSLVIDAFVFMRNDAIMRERIAILQADEANAELSIAAPKADIFDGRLTRGGSVPWSWACKSLGLAPQKLKEGLLGSKKFIKAINHDDGTETIKPPKAAFNDGSFVMKEFMGKSQWQVTARGYAWMQEHAPRWRGLIEERSKAKAKEYRKKRKAGLTQ